MKRLVEIMAETLHEQREMRRELTEELKGVRRELHEEVNGVKAVFNSGFELLANKLTEMKEEMNEIKLDVRSIDRRLRSFEDEQVLPRLLDLDHRLTVVERKVA